MRLALQPLIQRHVDLGSKAPITEALVDLQLPVDHQASLDSLTRLKERWEKTHTRVQTQTVWSSTMRLQPAEAQEPPSSTSSSAINGYAFFRDDDKSVAQARRNGFTLSRLTPYESWRSLIKSAKELWNEYVDEVRPEHVSRVALRYINQITLPPGVIELSDWFNIYPNILPNFGPLASFQLQTTVFHPINPSLRALVNFLPIPQQTESDPIRSNILLDIDVSTLGSFSPLTEVWDVLEDIHIFKNDLFFGSVTDRTLDHLRGVR